MRTKLIRNTLLILREESKLVKLTEILFLRIVGFGESGLIYIWSRVHVSILHTGY